jgi:hypothetical protein
VELGQAEIEEGPVVMRRVDGCLMAVSSCCALVYDLNRASCRDLTMASGFARVGGRWVDVD